MRFEPNQLLNLPELAAEAGLASSEFRIDRVISGGMGASARVVQGDRAFALKVIRPDIVDDPDFWRRYLREVRLWTTVSACDGVVEAFCVIRLNNVPVVCSRWMEGGNLRSHLKTQSPEFFFSVMARIVGTLAWAYDRHKVIHRDLKPENILLNESGLAFVSDWGIARPLAAGTTESDVATSRTMRSADDLSLTAVGSFLGTIWYASPEHLLGRAEIDHRTDIYSLGCLMYEWESGTCPFTGTTAEEVGLKHLFEAPVTLGGFFKRTAFGAESVIHACLEKDPKKRMPDYASLDHALAQAAKRKGVRYKTFRPSLRYEMPMVGVGEYQNKVKCGPAGYGITEFAEIEPFLREAQCLTAVEDYKKAENIYGSLFVPEMVERFPDFPHNQHVTINYALCLIAIGRPDEAVKALGCLGAASQKPDGYFVNLSLAQIKLSDYYAASVTAAEGLRLYPGSTDILGNLLIAQTELGAFADAAESAKVRLEQSRDVHSLQEVASLHCKYADGVRERDWPLAVKNLKYAISLLREAKELNPRYLPVRFQLLVALESITAYDQCSAEIVAAKELPLHVSDRAFLSYLFARCLDRVNAHESCLEFCDKWLKHFSESQATTEVARHNVVRLERVRAATIADGYCIGKMEDGKRVIVPGVAEFFAQIVKDEEAREAGDFCYLARFHEWLQEYEQAEDVLNTAEFLFPQYWEIPFQRAAFCGRAGDHTGALSSALRATELAPWRTQTWQLLGQVYDRLGDTIQSEAAKQRCDEVLKVRDRLNAEIDSV